MRLVITVLAALLLTVAPARAATTDMPWPPVSGPGTLFAHLGEEHINDADGATLVPTAIASVVRYAPRLVTFSGDKANDGKADQFALWRAAMRPLEDAGIAYLAGAGNHDRTAPPGVPGGFAGLVGLTLPDSLDVYKATFADRPYPWGDAPAYPGTLPARPASDPPGAATTFYVDIGDVRWIYLDNSCWTLTGCDPYQARADASTGTQLAYLQAKAQEATAAGKTVFVVMHVPTRDPRDQSYTDLTARNHIMGKGTSTDNAELERIAAGSGVDAVFVAHIKGQFLYNGQGGVPYYIDGGVGGELYTTGPVGVDHGYWHGYRLIRVDGQTITTDVIPSFVGDGIVIEGPTTLSRGQPVVFSAYGKQPVFNDTAKVARLELRDPAPLPRAAARALLGWKDIAFLAPVVLLVVAVGVARVRVLGRVGVVVVCGGVLLAGGVAVAQRSEPTSTPAADLPNPTRIWTSGDPLVLAPIASGDDDPRRDLQSQTQDGRFTGVCPGRTTLSITSGFETAHTVVTVASQPGRIVTGVQKPRGRARRGVAAQVVRVRLAQPAQVTLEVRHGLQVVRSAPRACVRGSRALRFTPRRAGRYTVVARVRSDRGTKTYRSSFRVG